MTFLYRIHRKKHSVVDQSRDESIPSVQETWRRSQQKWRVKLGDSKYLGILEGRQIFGKYYYQFCIFIFFRIINENFLKRIENGKDEDNLQFQRKKKIVLFIKLHDFLSLSFFSSLYIHIDFIIHVQNFLLSEIFIVMIQNFFFRQCILNFLNYNVENTRQNAFIVKNFNSEY